MGTRPDDLLALFRRLDVDDSGKLDQSELGPLARRMNMTPGELLRSMDKDGDKGITYSEFRRFMRGAKSGGFKDAMRPRVPRGHDGAPRKETGRANKGRVGGYRKKHKAVKYSGRRMPRLDRG